MKKQTIKVTLLALILAATLLLGASCMLFSGLAQAVCPHLTVYDGDCTNPGACASCGKAVGELGDHIYEKRMVYPDCINGGYAEYVCRVCQDSYREDHTAPKGHTYGEWIFDKQPTATEDGVMYRECSACGERETQTVAAHTHTMASAPAKAVTCTSDGWAAYEYCTLCEYSTRVIEKATGHSWGAYTSNGDSTHSRVCQSDPTHVSTEPCSGGNVSGSELPVCTYCHGIYEFAVRPGNSAYGYESLGVHTSYADGMKRLYKDLNEVCEQFYYSNADLTLEGEHYVIGKFDVTNYSLNLEAGAAVWKIFYVSNPLYYWIDARIVNSGNTLYLTVADDYARASERREADAAILKMTEECSLLIKEGMTDLEKAVTITAYIVENMEYAYENDGTTPVSDMWAHCMAGFAVKGLGVCEAYAKAFMYLCLLNGVDCRMGSGYAGEAHAWNYVEIDGVWYGADITWTDNSGDRAVYDYFGLSGSDIFSTHTSHSSTTLGGNFIYAPPTLSDKSIELTALYKDGEYYGLYKSIDEAFAAMTDTQSEYEIKIDYYGFYTSSPMHTMNATSTPNVKKLTITGRNEYVGSNMLDNNSLIRFVSSLTLNSDVELRNLHLISASNSTVYTIQLNGHTLTLGGDVVYMDNRVTSSNDKLSTLVIATTDISYVYGGVDIYKLVTGSVGVMLGSSSVIQICQGNKIYVPADDGHGNEVTVQIEHYR